MGLLVYLGRQLTLEDVLILFKSNIPEKIALNLLDFDTNQSKAEINPEFFQSLRKLTWKNSETKDFYKRTENLFGFFAFEEQGMKENSFILRQKRVIWFFCRMCSG